MRLYWVSCRRLLEVLAHSLVSAYYLAPDFELAADRVVEYDFESVRWLSGDASMNIEAVPVLRDYSLCRLDADSAAVVGDSDDMLWLVAAGAYPSTTEEVVQPGVRALPADATGCPEDSS